MTKSKVKLNLHPYPALYSECRMLLHGSH